MIHERLRQWSDHRRDSVVTREDVRVLAEIEKARALHDCASTLADIATALENIEGNLRGVSQSDTR